MKSAVVLVNLGTPEQPTAASVRQFLREFLSDQRVVELPRLLWYPILYGVILPFRSPRVAKAYASIWKDGDSPLRSITRRQVAALKTLLDQQYGENAPEVRYAMTYGKPSLREVIEELSGIGVQHTQIVPLYPQFSATTTGAVYDQVAEIQTSARDIPSINVLKSYHNHPAYIAALVSSVKEHWQEHGRGERLLLSYHGIPKRNVELGDPYYQQCLETSRLVAEKLGLSESEYSMTFQSRLGRAEWLQPYTVDVLSQWGEQKVKDIDVICPSFSVDCLETLEEIAVENAEVFSNAGGGALRLIPCLNCRDDHIEMIQELSEFSV